ncbi:MAG TPA: hypothetical protein PKD09_22585 [Aggregatilinea sp.]|uniref:hypothetical protein n=1 Tax=Aggregatilinea sp. TaxID=2806333 RepID=UPI002BBFBD69|nr:hypothetical protein [Aggregatilinea sp.]HML24459.1 hypothetical protein [Aggregatilinea sp.]
MGDPEEQNPGSELEKVFIQETYDFMDAPALDSLPDTAMSGSVGQEIRIVGLDLTDIGSNQSQAQPPSDKNSDKK